VVDEAVGPVEVLMIELNDVDVLPRQFGPSQLSTVLSIARVELTVCSPATGCGIGRAGGDSQSVKHLFNTSVSKPV
jgi:hypothetical protein